MPIFLRAFILAGLLAALPAVPSAMAAPCGEAAGSFNQWLDGFAREAQAKGISRSTIQSALGRISFDPEVVKKDRRQSVFSQSFLQFAGRMVAKYRMEQGAAKIRKYGKTFAAIERQFGVPAPVIVAFWGLETDFGANIGNGNTLSSLATLAYDCRRPELFREQLFAALKIIDRGDLTAGQMIGPWAGELGQTQFLPSHYVEYGVDFDGDGRRDLLRSTPDALASTAKYLAALGWKRGQPWLQEVRVPRRLPWEQADIAIQHPRSQWAGWGVRFADGSPLPQDNLKAALLLPMGHNGPAFLAYDNFNVYLEWNNSLVYSTTAAYFATRLGGAGPVHRGNGEVTPLSYQQMKSLQRLLAKRGYKVGKVDGILGAQTRSAVKDVQLKAGLPADSYPTPELLRYLGG